MLNYANLSDVEFEYLCQDIMQKKLGIELRRFASGRDGGIDLADNAAKNRVVVQVKHYINSPPSQLKTALQEEVPKVKSLSPKQYYLCCAKTLSPQMVDDIYAMFSNYMTSKENILTLNEIEDFLQAPQNLGILERHYKLWLESTGILQSVWNGDIFVDCEALLADIEKDKKLFVRTRVFDKALKFLSDNKTLLIIGDPGVGKSMTSKMLVLHYAARGYRVRFTSSSADLSSLKRSLSRDQDVKEIVLIDDCFGQAYFDLRDSQNNDLLSLIKYIHISKSKLLILNSRVTIFQEVRERKSDFTKSFENHEYGICLLDMSAIDDLEKAKIFYNHLFMNNIDSAYFLDIKTNRHYRTIISHTNYNPRIIEFVSNPNRYVRIAPERYFQFIRQNLDNPSEVWKDEYERRLGLADRILLLTVFSLSDVAVDEALVKTCFEMWIKNEPAIDRTINQYEASLRRLTDGFLRIVDEGGQKKIGVTNPSVNDYLRARILGDPAERDFLLRNVHSIRQFNRLLSEDEFSEFARSKVESGEVDAILFNDAQQRLTFIVWYIAVFQIQNAQYIPDIYAYLRAPLPLVLDDYTIVTVVQILSNLLIQPLIDYYELRNVIEELDLERIFGSEEPRELVSIINALSPLFAGASRGEFIRVSSAAVFESISDYCSDVDAFDYDPDVGSAIDAATFEMESGYGSKFDDKFAAQLIKEEVEDRIESEIIRLICKLPQDVRDMKNYFEGLDINISGADDLVDSYLSDSMYDYDEDYEDISPSSDEIDLIFER